MSRVGKKPISIPDNIKASYVDGIITIQAEKASLTRAIHPSVELKIEDNTIEVLVKTDDRKSRAFQGLVRSLIENMVIGVSKGFERVLEINGIGYRAEVNGNNIVFNIGYSNPITFDIPEGVSVSVDKNTVIKLSGIDKEQLGQTAAAIRRLRPPEPYKGKGIKYAEEYIKRKAGKTGAAATV
ncbi:MAG: 50S ribosomal protein L6 [Deltaproteobacteria bacterium]|nr:50S ribosomal protein L6 [Deltaproteobacteria bacterium]